MSDQHDRKRLPDTRRSITHRVKISDERGGESVLYITAGYYDDGGADALTAGSIGEVFLSMGKMGSTLKGMLDSFAIMFSLGVQYGVPVDAIVHKFKGVAFEPSGTTDNPNIPTCTSLVDYAARWIERHATLVEVA